MRARYTLFETRLGVGAVAWTSEGLCAVELPAHDAQRAAERIALKADAEVSVPAAWVKKLCQRLVSKVHGQAQDFSDVPLDLNRSPNFHRRAYLALQKLPAGQTISYAQLATLAGSPKALRAAGQAMANNPLPLVVPCHRVLASGAKLGGFSSPLGLAQKLRLLEEEGVVLRPEALRTPEAQVALAQRALEKGDPVLGACIRQVGACALSWGERGTPYQALSSAIVYQQLTGKAAATILGRYKALLGEGQIPPPEEVVRATAEKLRAAGLSGAKAAALKDLAQKTLEGQIPNQAALRRMDDEAVIEKLTQVRGIGRWTAEMFLLFSLGRPDVLSLGDYGLRKGYGRLFLKGKLPTPEQLAKGGERWRPFRSVASWYLWRACELPNT